MNSINLFCNIPSSILENVGSVLFVDLGFERFEGFCVNDKEVSTGFPHDSNVLKKIYPYLNSILYEAETLLLVFLSRNESADSVNKARMQLNGNLMPRAIGGVYNYGYSSSSEVCNLWIEKFCPRVCFAILDESINSEIVSNISKTPEKLRIKSEFELNKYLMLTDIQVANKPLKSHEMIQVALEAYAHGLPALSDIILKPLLDYWGLSTLPRTGIRSLIELDRTSTSQFSELCRRLNVHTSVLMHSLGPLSFPELAGAL